MINPHGSIFPHFITDKIKDKHENETGQTHTKSIGGLTKREIFAAIAVHARITLMADTFYAEAIVFAAKKNGKSPQKIIAKKAVSYADALIAELSKQEDQPT